MEKPLRILHLEDDPDFVALVSDMLKEEGLSAEMTSTQSFQDFITALRGNAFDLILADYSLPTCNGLQALHAVREKDPNTPFVLISGTIGEHAALWRHGLRPQKQTGTSRTHRSPRRQRGRRANPSQARRNGIDPPRKIFSHADGAFARHPDDSQCRRTFFIQQPLAENGFGL